MIFTHFCYHLNFQFVVYILWDSLCFNLGFQVLCSMFVFFFISGTKLNILQHNTCLYSAPEIQCLTLTHFFLLSLPSLFFLLHFWSLEPSYDPSIQRDTFISLMHMIGSQFFLSYFLGFSLWSWTWKDKITLMKLRPCMKAILFQLIINDKHT